MKKIYFLLLTTICMTGIANAQLFWNTNGVGNTLTATNWGTTAAGPFTTAWTNSSNINFTANSAITNVTTIPVGNLTVTNPSTVTWTAAGTFSTGGNVRTFDIGGGATLVWNGQGVSTAAGTGFIKNGAGVWNIGAQGNGYTGGFTLNNGIVIIGGTNAIGTGALTINGGAIAPNTAGARTPGVTGTITVGGDFALGDIFSAPAGTGNITFTNAVSLGAATSRKITIGNIGTYSLNGIISGAGSSLIIDNAAGGTISYGAVNTYDGGTTIQGGAILRMGIANALPASGKLTLNGGILRTGATTGFTQSTGNLNLTTNSSIVLGTGVHSLTFLNSSAEPWTAATTLTITGWSGGYDGTAGTAGRIFVGSDATGLTAAQLAQITFRDGSNNPFPAVILSTGEVVPGATVTVADIALSSLNPAVAAGNISQGTFNNIIYKFDLAVTTANATLNGVTINTAGTYVATDFTNFRCWYSADNVFNSGTDVLLSTITPAVAGAQAFTPFTNQSISSGNTGYIFITASAPCGAVVGNTISVNAIATTDISFLSGNKTGTAFAGDLQTIIAATPNDVTTPAASVANASSSVSWVNPAGCYSEVMIIASQGAANTGGIPTGDGTAYTAALNYGAGSAYGNGFVVYKGNTSPQVITGLTNGTIYYYKFYTRLGTTWSTNDVEVSATPAVVTAASDYFRSVAPGGNWGSAATWESSPNGLPGSWIAASLIPDANANTITIQNTADVTVAATAGGDQIVVEAGATLTLGANFTLANGAGTDLDVFGTVINSAGTHTFTGTADFHPATVYRHNRNGGAAPTATWDITSLFEVTGGTTAAPTNITQTLGNFTWNSNTTTTTNLVGSLTTVAGNFRVQNSGTAALRLTGAADLNLTVGGNFTVEDDLDIDNNATGVCNISIGGNFAHTSGTFQSSADVAIITMTGSGKTFTQSGGTFTNTNLNWIIAGGANLTLANALPIATARTVLVTGTLDAAALQISGAGAVTVDGTLRTANTNGLELTGTLANSGSNTLGTSSTVDYYAAGAQVFSTRTDYASVIINGGGNKTLNGIANLTGNLTLTNGIVVSTAPNLLTLSNTASVTSASNASYVNGPVKKIGNTPFTFPVGKANGYVPIGVSNFTGLSAATDEFTAEYVRASGAALGIVTAPLINRVSGCEYWTLNVNNGTPTVDLTLYWNANNPCNGTYIANLPDLEVAHSDGTNWNSSSFGFSAKNGTTAAGDITWTGVSTFSPFTLASTSGTNPLPITINYFNGTKNNGNHLLNWKVTCISTPSATLEVERSIDGRNYSSIYSIFATAVRCAQPFDYNDNAPAKGVNYYRLKMTDVDGKVTYSSIVSLINATKGIDIMNIAPNPVVGGKFNIRMSSATALKASLVISDMQGRFVQQQTLIVAGGFNVLPVNVQNLAASSYQAIISTADGDKKLLRFVVQ